MNARHVLISLGATLIVAGCLPGAPRLLGRECIGVPGTICQRALDDAVAAAPPGAGGVVGIRVRCVVARCTEDEGEAEVTVTYADGGSTSRWAWATVTNTPGPAPTTAPTATPIPLVPTCLGVPLGWCREQAAVALGDGPAGSAVSVVVRCSTRCTDESGDGTTVVTDASGSRSEVSWSYRGAAPTS